MTGGNKLDLSDVAALPLPLEDAFERLALAAAVGLVVAGLYFWTLGRKRTDNAIAMPLTLVLLSLLVAMVMVIVGNSVARAFTLGGTLAIIRYRTTVDDTRDTAFVIAAVVAGMGVGTGMASVVGIGITIFAVVVIAAFFIGMGRDSVGPAHRLTIRINPDRDPEMLAPAFAVCPRPPLLLGMETAKQGTAIDVQYLVKMLDTPRIMKLMASLRQIEGVLAVELKPN